MTQQFLRKISLIVADQQGNGIDLSAMRIVFSVSHLTMQMPSTLVARVYNLSTNTINQIRALAPDPTREGNTFPQIILQAGYEGNYGRIFQGQVKQLKQGAESNIDSYLDIFAADGDPAYNWGVINIALAAGYTPSDVFAACSTAYTQFGGQPASPPDALPKTPSPRGKSCFGMVRDTMSDLASTHLMTWGIQDSKLQMVPQSSYLPGEAIVLNSKTGVIGVPEVTQQGIKLRCLLNPSIGTSIRIQLNNAEVAQYLYEHAPTSLNIEAVDFPPEIAADGIYKVIFVDHVGDTRGNQWYSEVTCLSVNGVIIPTGLNVLDIPFQD